MWTDFFDKIFLINLVARTKKLERAEQELTRYHIPYEIIKGTHLKRNGKYGLFLTFKNIMLSCRRCRQILIFEDDVLFLRDPANIMEKCIAQLSVRDWDLFYLGPNTHIPFPGFADQNLLPLQDGLSTHAVAYANTAVDMIVKMPWQDQPIDKMLAKDIQPLGRSFCSYPMLATQADGWSDVDLKIVQNDYIEKRFTKHSAALIR